jgi:hypothetical protein
MLVHSKTAVPYGLFVAWLVTIGLATGFLTGEPYGEGPRNGSCALSCYCTSPLVALQTIMHMSTPEGRQKDVTNKSLKPKGLPIKPASQWCRSREAIETVRYFTGEPITMDNDPSRERM